MYEFFLKYLSLQKKTKLLSAINNYTKWRSSLKLSSHETYIYPKWHVMNIRYIIFTKYTTMWYNGQLCIAKCVKHTAQILCSCLQIIYGITCKFVIQFSHNIPSVPWIS